MGRSRPEFLPLLVRLFHKARTNVFLGSQESTSLVASTHTISGSNQHRLSGFYVRMECALIIRTGCSGEDPKCEFAIHVPGVDTHKHGLKGLRLARQTQNGVYTDDCTGIHPDLINLYYGTTPSHLRRGVHQTGAGNPPEEESRELLRAVAEDITLEQNHNIRHEAVPVPKHESPFTTEVEEAFLQMLREAQTKCLVPQGYGATPSELGGDWEPIEMIKTGPQRRANFPVDLPEQLWLPRLYDWVRGIHLLENFQIRLEHA
jgi:hypothetical protein